MSEYNTNQDYYAVLSIEDKATEQEIRKAYKKAALKHHPDKGGDEEMFKVVSNAYETLCDPIKKRQYDTLRTVHKNNLSKTPPQNSPEHSPCMERESENYSYTYENTRSEHKQKQQEQVEEEPELVFTPAGFGTTSQNQSIILRDNNTPYGAQGVKATDMAVADLKKLALQHEYVALHIVKSKKLVDHLTHNRYGCYEEILVDILRKHPNAAYQFLAKARHNGYLEEAQFYGHDLKDILMLSYETLLLVVASDYLTEKLLFSHNRSTLNGSELYDIYQHYINQRGQVDAFELLLSNNPKLKQLFDNEKSIRDGKSTFTIAELQLLGFNELAKLAESQQEVAELILTNRSLLNQFRHFVDHPIKLVIAYPHIMDHLFVNLDIFNSRDTSHYELGNACLANYDFFLQAATHSSKLFHKTLYGHLLDEIIKKWPQAKNVIQTDEILSAHLNGYYAVKQFLKGNTITPTADLLKAEYVYKYHLSDIVIELQNDTNIHMLAVKTANLLASSDANFAPSIIKLCQHSTIYFSEFWKYESLRKTLLDDFYKKDILTLANQHFEIFTTLIQAAEYQALITDEEIVDLQQCWIKKQPLEVAAIFNQSTALMERWHKGHAIKKLQDGVEVKEYQEQATLCEEAGDILDIRELNEKINFQLSFNAINLPKADISFSIQLIDDIAFLEKFTSVPNHEQLLPGMMWYQLFTQNPILLNEDLPLTFIHQQLQSMLENIQNNDALYNNWLLLKKADTYIAKDENQQIHHWTELLKAHGSSTHFEEIFNNDYFLQNLLENSLFDDVDFIKTINKLDLALSKIDLSTLTEAQLTHLIFHYALHMPDTEKCEALIVTLYNEIKNQADFFIKVEILNIDQHKKLYQILLENKLISAKEFLLQPSATEALKQEVELQTQFIALAETQREDCIEAINELFSNSQYEQAQVPLSLMIDKTIVEDIEAQLPVKAELDTSDDGYALFNAYVCIGLAGLAISAESCFFLPELIPAIAIVGVICVALIAYGLYKYFTPEVKEPEAITYQEALSKNNIGLFFDSKQTSCDKKEEELDNDYIEHCQL